MRLLALLLALLAVAPTARAQANAPREVRGIWVPAPQHTTFWSSRETLAEQMDYYAARGFNVIFPVVWVGGYTLYPSQVMQDRFGVAIHPDVGASRRNMLAELIVEARRVGMEVIPWFEYGFATHYGDSGGHILQARPDWAARDRFGNFAIQYRDPGTGTGFTWMNGINPEVQDFLLDLVREVVTTFDVDGVQGDDRLPAMPAIAGYDAYTVALYRSEHGGQNPPQNPSEPAFMQWKANKLSAFGRRLYDMVKEIDENLIVSMSPSIYPFSVQNYLQDWPAWLAAGQVDMIHPQAYRWGNVEAYKNLIREMAGPVPGSPLGHVRPEHRSKLFPGIVALVGSQRNGPAYLREAVRFNREFGLAGEVFFFNEGLRARNEFAADTLFATHYATPSWLPGRTSVRRPPPEIITLGSARAEQTGPWTSAPSVAGFAGPMRYAERGTGAHMTYRLEVSYPGYYDVYAFQPNAFATRTAHYTLVSATDTSVVVVDQLGATNTRWTVIGTVYLAPDAPGRLVLDPDAVTDPDPRLHRTYADAVMLQLNRRLTPGLVVGTTAEPPAPTSGSPLTVFPGAPNPSRGETTLRFALAAPADVSVHVYDTLGRRVASLQEAAPHAAGEHRLRADLRHLAPGLYLYRVSAGDAVQTRTLTIAR